MEAGTETGGGRVIGCSACGHVTDHVTKGGQLRRHKGPGGDAWCPNTAPCRSLDQWRAADKARAWASTVERARGDVRAAEAHLASAREQLAELEAADAGAGGKAGTCGLCGGRTGGGNVCASCARIKF